MSYYIPGRKIHLSKERWKLGGAGSSVIGARGASIHCRLLQIVGLRGPGAFLRKMVLLLAKYGLVWGKRSVLVVPPRTSEVRPIGVMLNVPPCAYRVAQVKEFRTRFLSRRV